MGESFTSYVIEDRSFISFIKREIHGHVVREKFPTTKVAETDIVISELTSNLIKHAGGGELLYRINHDDESPALEILSIDNGPGISDLARMMKDGVSTTNTLGQGLGAIQRLSDESQIYSLPRWGTIIYCVLRATPVIKKPKEKGSLHIDVNALCVSKPRETECGDGYRIRRTATAILIFFADGLGHGSQAKEAVDAAGKIFMECRENEPVAIIRLMHENIRKTRGLVGTISVFDLTTNEFRFCGVGNIHSRFYSGIESRNFMSYNGAVGLNLPHSLNISRNGIEKNQQLIMCSDGIQTRWDLSRYPTISKYDTMLLAAALYKDFARRTDDSSVLIAKVN